MTRPIQASLDLQALKQNLSIVRRAATHARVWSVVKRTLTGMVLSVSGARSGPLMALHCLTSKRQ